MQASAEVAFAAKVDKQNASDLVFKGLAQPSGYTEPLLHPWRMTPKAWQLMAAQTPGLCG